MSDVATAPAKGGAKMNAPTSSAAPSAAASPVSAAAPSSPATAVVPPRIKPQISGQAIRLAENGRNLWHAVAPHTHTLEDVLDPIYLFHGHDRIAPGDRVEIRHQLHHFLVELYVVEVDKDTQGILTYVLSAHDFTTTELRVADLTGATVEEMGLKWAVRQGKRVLKAGFDTEMEALAWLEKKKQRRKALASKAAV